MIFRNWRNGTGLAWCIVYGGFLVLVERDYVGGGAERVNLVSDCDGISFELSIG